MKRPAQNSYFDFSRKDRLAAAAFLLLVGLLAVAPHLFPNRGTPITPIPDSLLVRTADREDFSDRPYGEREAEAYYYNNRKELSTAGSPFPFDPNTLDSAGWLRLGLPPKVIRTLLRYRSKGGRFRNAEDLRKIWSLPPGFYERVSSFVRIGSPGDGADGARSVAPPTRPARPIATVEVNEADSAAWEALPGIGAKLAARIVRFRERLGGFVRVDQVAETWGLTDSTFRRILPFLTLSRGKNIVRKFNLNSVTKEELKQHPYLRWNQVNGIIEYRLRHGPYASVEELRRLLILPDSVFERVAPYFEIK